MAVIPFKDTEQNCDKSKPWAASYGDCVVVLLETPEQGNGAMFGNQAVASAIGS
ncbi:MAG: hypothetical protein N2C12_00160 [Planctomycetales bacterium]